MTENFGKYSYKSIKSKKSKNSEKNEAIASTSGKVFATIKESAFNSLYVVMKDEGISQPINILFGLVQAFQMLYFAFSSQVRNLFIFFVAVKGTKTLIVW